MLSAASRRRGSAGEDAVAELAEAVRVKSTPSLLSASPKEVRRVVLTEENPADSVSIMKEQKATNAATSANILFQLNKI